MTKIRSVFYRRNKLPFVKVFCFLFLISFKISGQGFSDKNDRIRLLNKGVSFYIDPTDNLSSQKIINTTFTPSEQGILNFYNTAGKNLWIKFSLKNNSSYPTLFLNIDYSLLDKVTLYTYKNQTPVDSFIAGFNVRNSYQNPFFNLNLNLARQQCIY